MPREQIKVPIKGGIDVVRHKLKEMRKKSPSPELVKIIEEVTQRDKPPKPAIDSNNIAAKSQKPSKRDLDL